MASCVSDVRAYDLGLASSGGCCGDVTTNTFWFRWQYIYWPALTWFLGRFGFRLRARPGQRCVTAGMSGSIGNSMGTSGPKKSGGNTTGCGSGVTATLFAIAGTSSKLSKYFLGLPRFLGGGFPTTKGGAGCFLAFWILAFSVLSHTSNSAGSTASLSIHWASERACPWSLTLYSSPCTPMRWFPSRYTFNLATCTFCWRSHHAVVPSAELLFRYLVDQLVSSSSASWLCFALPSLQSVALVSSVSAPLAPVSKSIRRLASRPCSTKNGVSPVLIPCLRFAGAILHYAGLQCLDCVLCSAITFRVPCSYYILLDVPRSAELSIHLGYECLQAYYFTVEIHGNNVVWVLGEDGLWLLPTLGCLHTSLATNTCWLRIFVFHGSGFSKCPAVLPLHVQVLHDHVTIRDVNAQRLILDLPSAVCILATAVASVNKPKQLLVLPSP
ncbi:hypothetical protein Pelo_4253 [Pelomyxa schiedti]|nr:hypothetical protein Pelo_4253 [Pelomyxa schiedti]